MLIVSVSGGANNSLLAAQNQPNTLADRLNGVTVLSLGLGFIGVATGLISLILLNKQDHQLKQLNKNYRDSQQEIKTLNQKLDSLKEEQSHSYHKLKNNYKTLKIWGDRLPELSQEIQQQRERLMLLEQGKPTLPAVDLPTAPSLPAIPTVSELDFIIDQFNQKNIAYFQGDTFFPLKPTPASVEGSHFSLDGRSQIEFETLTDNSQASYLGFGADGATWLIPNITLANVGRIINQLEDNPGIFSLSPTSGDRQLTTPAKLQSLGTGLWKIERLGEFG
jgi:hypothetical protein